MLRDLENYSAVLQNPWMLAPAVLLVAVVSCLQLLLRTEDSAEACGMLIRVRVLLAGVAAARLRPAAANELRFCLRADPKTFNPLLVEDESSADRPLFHRRRADPAESLHAGTGRRAGHQMESLGKRPAHRFRAAPRRALLRWHAVHLRRRGLHHAPVDGSGAAFAGGRRVSLGARRRGNQVLGALRRRWCASPARWRRWPRSSIKWPSCRRIRRERIRRAGSVRVGRIQTRRLRSAAAQSELLETRCERPCAAVSRFHPPGHPAESRDWSCCGSGAGNSTWSTSSIRRCTTGCRRRCRTRWWTPGPRSIGRRYFSTRSPTAPLPEYKRRWFRSTDFRRAISEAIRRDDIVRIVYHGHARPAAGPVSVANRFWLNPALKPGSGSDSAAMALLAAGGLPSRRQCVARSRRQQSRVLDDHQRGQQAARTHAGFDPAGSGAVRDPAQCRGAGLSVAHRTHQPHVQLRSGSDGVQQPGS